MHKICLNKDVKILFPKCDIFFGDDFPYFFRLSLLLLKDGILKLSMFSVWMWCFEARFACTLHVCGGRTSYPLGEWAQLWLMLDVI